MRHLSGVLVSVIMILVGFFVVRAGIMTLPGQGDPTLEAANALAVTRNGDWTPVMQDFDGVSMVLVPPGCFMMGTSDDEMTQLTDEYGDFFADEAPQHEQCFATAFWIDQTEVTQAQFAAFGGQAENPVFYPGDNRPVESVSWFEAQDLCELRGARLPTEAEWEYAARGPDGLLYPWGDEWAADRAVWDQTGRQGTSDVGLFPTGASWVGALDMTGNVWEWVSSQFLPYPYSADDGREEATGNRTNLRRTLRGGSWFNDELYIFRAADRHWNSPIHDYSSVGFRCARPE